MRGRGRRGVLVVVAVLAAILIVAGAWQLWTVGSVDPGAVPARLRLMGRVYRVSGNEPVAVIAPEQDRVVLEPVIGTWPVVAPWEGLGRAVTPTVVWLHLRDGGYQGYELSGGP